MRCSPAAAPPHQTAGGRAAPADTASKKSRVLGRPVEKLQSLHALSYPSGTAVHSHWYLYSCLTAAPPLAARSMRNLANGMTAGRDHGACVKQRNMAPCTHASLHMQHAVERNRRLGLLTRLLQCLLVHACQLGVAAKGGQHLHEIARIGRSGQASSTRQGHGGAVWHLNGGNQPAPNAPTPDQTIPAA